MANFFSNKERAQAAKEASSSSKAKTTVPDAVPRMQPWVEKYRPRDLSEVKSQEHTTNILRRMVNTSNLPHLLCYGPPGSGKTSTILALARELFGPLLMANRTLELNASDERGLSVVRERVKNFAAQSLIHAPQSEEYRKKYPCPPIKIIILDEADSLTQDAQSALRRTMEVYSKITRFCLCCNYVSKIIDPIASRCSKFRFKALEGSQAEERVRYVLEKEGVEYEDGVIEKTLEIAEGDLRRTLNLLQSAAKLAGAQTGPTNGHAGKKLKKKAIADDSDEEMSDAPPQTKSKPIKKADIDEIAGIFPPELADHLIVTMQKGNTSNYRKIADEVSDIVASGYAANEVLLALYNKLIYDDLIDSKKKYKLGELFSRVDMALIQGVDEHITLLDLVLSIAGILQ